MAFSASDMDTFSRRIQNWMSSFQNLREEAARLESIYQNEAAYGADAEFVATNIATKQEHVDAVVMFGALKSFTENAAVATLDRTQTITPFTQQV